MTFYVETECLTIGAAPGSAYTPKVNSYEAETVEDACVQAAAFWKTNGYEVGSSKDVTAQVEAQRKARLSNNGPYGAR